MSEPPENLLRMSDIEIERHWQHFNANPARFRKLWKDGRVYRTVHVDLVTEQPKEVAVYNALTGKRTR